MPLIDRVLSLLLVEDREEARAALRGWLLTSLPPVKLREARNISVNGDSEALRTAAIEAGALAFVSKRELPHALLALVGRLPS